MQDLKLSIEGEWWDSLLYKGRLHLFGIDGSLQTFNWEELISDLAQSVPPAARDAVRFAFSESNALYRNVIDGGALGEAFTALAITSFSLPHSKLMNYIVSQGDSPFPFPHATSAFYYDRLITASSEGVHGALFDGFSDAIRPANRLTDLPANQAWPAYGAIAVAAGADGLHEIQLGAVTADWLRGHDPVQVSARTTDACDWMFQNIVAMSIDEGSFLVRYTVDQLDDQTPLPEDMADEAEKPAPIERNLESEEDLQSVLERKNARTGKSFVWGSQDKFYRAENGQITVYRLLKTGQIIQAGKPIPMTYSIDELVSVQTSLFGIVMEFDTGLLVLTSDEVAHPIPGEPVNWRVFPRSKRYENHLHVISDEALYIHSFNQDPQVDQFSKRIGSKYYPRVN